MSHCITCLAKRKLLQRKTDHDDARSYQISITPRGKEKVIKLIKIFDGIQNFFEKKIGGKKVVSFNKKLSDFNQLYQQYWGIR